MFGGVFTPCTLTILGVIMFLRFGYVVGQAGIIYALAIIAVSKLITVLTTLSLSAIATNTEVKGGGAYFLISRSLGVEFGAAIGLVFFFAQAISVAMYVIGFSEAFRGGFPWHRIIVCWDCDDLQCVCFHLRLHRGRLDDPVAVFHFSNVDTFIDFFLRRSNPSF